MKHILENFFNDQWNLYKLIEFVKHLRYASICIFDALGIIEIHRNGNVLVNGNLNDDEFIDDHGKVNLNWYKKGLAVISENHIEGLFNKNIIQSTTKNGYIKEFTKHITDDDTFDFFEDIERKLMDDTYEELGKHNEANVLS